MKIKKYYYRIYNGIKLCVWGIKNPDILNETMFKSLSDLFLLILRVATEEKPYMTKIMVSIDKEVKQPIVNLWVGSGILSDPYDRIRELSEENNLLKEQIKNNLTQHP